MKNMIGGILTGLGMAVGLPAGAAPVTIIHSFGTHAQLGGGLIAGPDGTVFGTTYNGGTGCAGNGCGTVFSLAPPAHRGGVWTYTKIYAFTNHGDGYGPSAPLTLGPDGVLYGASSSDTSGSPIFSLTPPKKGASSWRFAVIAQLASGNIAGAGDSALILSGGALYGVAQGGAGQCSLGYPCGSVFQAAPSVNGPWTVTSIVTFNGNALGGNPNGIVGPDSAGGFYVSTGYRNNVDYVAPGRFGWKATVAAKFAGEDHVPGCLVLGANDTVYGVVTHYGSGDFVAIAPASGGGWTTTYLLRVSDHHYAPCPDIVAPNGALIGTVFGDQDFFAGSVFQLTPPSAGGGWVYQDIAKIGRTGRYGPSNAVLGWKGDLYGLAQEAYGPPPAVFELKY